MGNKLGNFCVQPCCKKEIEAQQTNDLSREGNEDYIRHVKAKFSGFNNVSRSDDTKFESLLADSVIVNTNGKITEFISDDLKIMMENHNELPSLDSYLDDSDRIHHDCVFFNESGVYYEGEWNENGLFHGRGTKVTEDSVYEGTFRNGNFDGFGRFISIEGDYYQGEFKNGKCNGKGKFVLKYEFVYEGDWFNDMRHGWGKETLPNGEVYEGEFKDNEKTGEASISFIDGSKFKGKVRKGKFQGEGKRSWPDGRKYKGDFKDGLMSGIGKFEFKSGQYYEGHFKKDKREGKGTFFESSDFYIIGMWSNDKLDGNCTVYSGDKKFEIVFRRGKAISVPVLSKEQQADLEKIEQDAESIFG